MTTISPSTSELSLVTTTSADVDEETKNLFRDYKEMTKDELNNSIDKCKSLIQESAEMSPQRKWLIRRLIDLRLRHAQMNTSNDDTEEEKEIHNILGHYFKALRQHPKRMFCDWCTNVIWIFQQCYCCTDCSYIVHVKCLKYVSRVCAHVVASEKGHPEYRICPEVGLSMQLYRCAECKVQLMNSQFYLEPRKCHYSGLYFCKTCHWNNYSIIPGNIIHNWDFEQQPVSRQSLQIIRLFYERPVIKLEELNPKLFVFVQKLGNIRQKRHNLMELKRYLDVCKFALNDKLIDNTVGTRRYMLQNSDYYSLYDLVCVENCSLQEYLQNAFHILKKHIMSCLVSCKMCIV
jgi:hypothetical protein